MSWGVDGVSVRFGSTLALYEVSLDLEPGELAIVVGADGAGKTTLCRTIVGLDDVESGSVRRPARMGFQPESSGVWGDLTVIENLEFVAGAYGLEPAHARTMITDLLEVTTLDSARHRLGHQLSGGMRQKLGVAMAVLSEPELLVLDEPTTGLDPVSRLELWSFITLSTRGGRAVVVTTTYFDEAMRGNKVLALDEGEVLAAGSVDDVVAAMPGRLFETDRPHGANSWHRGGSWRVWSSDGSPVPNSTPTDPDLADVVTVAALAREARR
jgi:ABC-2 type transport system ATP-binding protein